MTGVRRGVGSGVGVGVGCGVSVVRRGSASAWGAPSGLGVWRWRRHGRGVGVAVGAGVGSGVAVGVGVAVGSSRRRPPMASTRAARAGRRQEPAADRGMTSRRAFIDRAYAGRAPIDAGRWSAAGPPRWSGPVRTAPSMRSVPSRSLRPGLRASSGSRAFRCESPDVSVQVRRPSSRVAQAHLRDSHGTAR